MNWWLIMAGVWVFIMPVCGIVVLMWQAIFGTADERRWKREGRM